MVAKMPRRLNVLLLGWGLCALIAAAGTGCSHDGGLSLEPVEGSVAYRGKPLPGGTVVFHSIGHARGPQAMGAIQKDGSFQMQTLGKLGATIGDYRVTVSYRRELTPQEAKNLVIPEQLIPKAYGKVDQTPLAFSVKQGGDNFLRIDLED